MPWTHALDLTKATVKAQGVSTPVTHRDIVVDDNTMQLIRLGDQVIRQTRQLLPYGAGNQKSDLTTNPEAGPRTAATQMAFGTNFPRPQYVGGAALMFKSGNCQDQAAVVYLLLREALGNGHIISYGCAPSAHHSFCLVRPAALTRMDQIVVVDSWPKYPQAMLWQHHFCYPEFQLYVEKPGAGHGGKLQKAFQKFNNQAFYNAVASAATLGGPYGSSWNHKWASASHDVLRYYVDDPMDTDVDMNG